MSDDALGNLEEMGHSVSSEMCLLGNILQNMELFPQYKNVLSENDFEDQACNVVFQIISEYYLRFGTAYDTFKMGLIIAEFAEKNPKISKLASVKQFYPKIISPIIALGSANQPANSNVFSTVKRNSTIRQLLANGFPVEKLLKSENVNMLTADDVIGIVQRNLDALSHTTSLTCAEDIGCNLVEKARQFLDAPEIGIQTPFSFINIHMHGLCKNDVTMLGGVTNSGKGRCLFNLLAYIICVEQQSVYVMANEMTTADYIKTLICTIVNSPAIQDLHGRRLMITQSDIVQNRFHNDTGEVVKRAVNESSADFESRLLQESAEYRDYTYVVQWFQDNFANKLHIVNVSENYNADRLKSEIRRAESLGCSVVVYDTLKAYQSAEWGDLLLTATTLSEYIKSSTYGIHGLFTFQLTNDSNTIKPEQMSINNIAHAKNIAHVADNILVFQQMKPEIQKQYYSYERGFKENVPEDAKIAAFKILKNRRGNGKDGIYAVQNNLDLNIWQYCGEIFPHYKKAA